MSKIGYMQLGKQGITDSFMETLKNYFKTHLNIRISVLKSAGHDKKKVKEYSEKILERLGKNYTSKIIGFTIVLKKWRREMR